MLRGTYLFFFGICLDGAPLILPLDHTWEWASQPRNHMRRAGPTAEAKVGGLNVELAFLFLLFGFDWNRDCIQD